MEPPSAIHGDVRQSQHTEDQIGAKFDPVLVIIDRAASPTDKMRMNPPCKARKTDASADSNESMHTSIWITIALQLRNDEDVGLVRNRPISV